MEIKKRWTDSTTTRIKSGAEVVFPDDPEKNKETNEKAIKLWKEWLQDEKSTFTMVHFELTYQNLYRLYTFILHSQ